MHGLDYAGLMRLGQDTELRGRSFTLRFGPWEIASVPFATLVTLGGDPGFVHELVDRCFVAQDALHRDGPVEELDEYGDWYAELRSMLADAARRLDAASESRALVLREIVCRWQEAAADAVEGLAGPAVGFSTAARRKQVLEVLAEYRLRAYGVVSALVQLLPVDDPSTGAIQGQLDRARAWLVAAAGIGSDELREAVWFAAEPPQAEVEGVEVGVGSQTWGIP